MSIWTDRDGRLHVAIMRDGRRIHRRLPAGGSQGDAKHLEAELRVALGRRTPTIPGDPPLAAVMSLYLDHAQGLRSPETARYHALRAGPWVAQHRASEAPQVAARMVSDLRRAYAPATINRTLGALKAALTLAYRQGLTPADYGGPIARLAEHNARHVYLTLEQVRTLTDHASEQVRAAVWIALLTGCRRGEILALRAEDVGHDTLTIRAGNTKTLRQRTVPVVAALRPWLEHVPLRINAEGLKTGFRRARQAAGLAHVRFHDLRHSCASLLIALGADLVVIRDILGHSSVRMTERYAHLQVGRQREALDQLSDAVQKRCNS